MLSFSIYHDTIPHFVYRERAKESARANELALPFCTNSKHTADKSTLERKKRKKKLITHMYICFIVLVVSSYSIASSHFSC